MLIFRKKKIILAEGEPIIADILPRFLKPIGYEVIVTSDGASALQTIKQHLPDLIIVDSDLKEIDGFSLCQMLKSDFLTSYIPIIILIEKRQLRKRLLEIKEGIDDYIIKPPDPIDLQVRLEIALRRTDHQVHANSLTRLPGNRAIEHEARLRLKARTPLTFMYLDIDRFKSFNDTYGYLRGDGVIMQTAKILTDAVSRYGCQGDFVGHVGGDDFVVMTIPDKEKILAKNIIREFDRLILFHYTQEVRQQGFLVSLNREHRKVRAPLMSLSVAIVNNKFRDIHNIIELTEIASEIKSYLKNFPGSKYLSNRRVLSKTRLSREQSCVGLRLKVSWPRAECENLPLGQLLLQAKFINENQLTEALIEHWTSRQLLGQILVRMGFLRQTDLDDFLRKKEEKPVFQPPAL